MYGSRKQYWILEMIKGVDLIPAGGAPGNYSARGCMTISNEKGERTSISPEAVLDLSHPELLKIETPDQSFSMSWSEISRIEFDTPAASTTPVLKPAYEASQHKLLPFPAGKKAG